VRAEAHYFMKEEIEELVIWIPIFQLMVQSNILSIKTN